MKDTLELKSIPLDQIEYNPVNTKIFNMDDIEHLAKTIKEEGYNDPILVFKNKNGRYEILYQGKGHRNRQHKTDQLGS